MLSSVQIFSKGVLKELRNLYQVQELGMHNQESLLLFLALVQMDIMSVTQGRVHTKSQTYFLLLLFITLFGGGAWENGANKWGQTEVSCNSLCYPEKQPIYTLGVKRSHTGKVYNYKDTVHMREKMHMNKMCIFPQRHIN